MVIETQALSKQFGRKSALKELTLSLPRGGVHAVVGSNGAGKSTLFRILLGLLSPSSGWSRILGEDSQSLTPEVRGRIGLVHEEHTLPGWISVRRLKSMQAAQYPRWQEEVYDEVLGHFNVLPEQKIAQLSRGERAGVNLALALAQRPELLILDEPTLGLDVVAKQSFLESLLFAGERGDCTVVYCSHQMDEVERVADNLMILERGELVSMAPPEDFCARISGWMVDWQDPPVLEAIPGLLQAREIDGQQQLMILDQDAGFSECLKALGANSVHQLPIGLNQAVNAYLTRNHSAPLSGASTV
ncbi:MAG: ABC transporter ATP-binding protein [Deltaproteobacteria bacterium]|nr:ABC transporter ATP-binding protein [Deltaproteobacteria bacterium]